MANTKQKPEQPNGTPHEPMNLTAAQHVIEQAANQRRERFQVEYERLCAEYGYEVAGRPAFSPDGRIGVAMVIQKRGG